MMCGRDGNDFYSTTGFNSYLGYLLDNQQVLCLTGSSLDTNSITFFVLSLVLISRKNPRLKQSLFEVAFHLQSVIHTE